MKALWIYVIIGASAVTVGATAGIVAKRFMGATNTVYVGELEEFDIDKVMARYEANPNQEFTLAETVNIALEKYRRCENSYSVSKGSAKTIVNQTIRNYQIKNGNKYFEESISMSSMVSLANRMYQTGKASDVDCYYGKASSPETGNYPATPTTRTSEEYKEKMGRTLDEMFIYVITNQTVLKEGSSSKKTSTGYEITLSLNPNTSTYYYKQQMFNISGLDALPVFEYVTLKYTLTSDLMLEHLSVDEKYKAAMVAQVDIVNALETDFYPNGELKIPQLDEYLEYKLKGE